MYTDSTLENTSRFYLVDFFEDETAKEILMSEGLSEDDAGYVVDWIGGVPWMLEEVLESSDPSNTIQELFKDIRSRLKVFLIEKSKDHEKVLKDILSGRFNLDRENIELVKDLVEAEILFYDPVEGDIRFQTRLDEGAACEILKIN